MRLNPEKWTFDVSDGKFLGFYLTEKVIESNSDKREADMQMNTPTLKKEVMKLNIMVTALNIFISKAAQRALSFYKFLKK